ncbi:MAG: flagellar basal body rod protein FlgB [Gammaproteobacteria bacterium]|nr:flagellar basal body rod protein FlgB [Gammaproteobacteria bacterium]
MAISIDKAFGAHERAMLLKAQRSEVLAANLANADTPNYKARDIDFKAALNQVQSTQHSPLMTTHDKHIGSSDSSPGSELLYRVPEQSSLDGNTVDARVEQAEFTENALQYQASLTFLGGRIQGLRNAIRGE